MLRQNTTGFHGIPKSTSVNCQHPSNKHHALLLLLSAVALAPLQLPDSRTFPCIHADRKLSCQFELKCEHKNLWELDGTRLVADFMRDTSVTCTNNAKTSTDLVDPEPSMRRTILAPQMLTTSDHAEVSRGFGAIENLCIPVQHLQLISAAPCCSQSRSSLFFSYHIGFGEARNDRAAIPASAPQVAFIKWLIVGKMLLQGEGGSKVTPGIHEMCGV